MSSAILKPMRLVYLAVASVVALLAFLSTAPLGTSAAPALVESTFVYVPQTAVRGRPLQVVVAIHGLGGNGKTFGSELIELADRNDWVIVAPKLRYGNWWNVEELVREDTMFSHWLVAYLDNLQVGSGVIPRERVLLFGFSRGAGVISRFAVLHPGRVLASVVLSSGAYTLPSARDEKGRPLVFPFGVADLTAHGGAAFDSREFASTRWFVGVGDSDTEPRELPQVWTPYIGSTRVERARKFSAALQSAGAEVTLRIFPDTRHFLTTAMRSEAVSFLRTAAPTPALHVVPAAAPTPAPRVVQVVIPVVIPVEAPTPAPQAPPADGPPSQPESQPAAVSMADNQADDTPVPAPPDDPVVEPSA